MSSNDVVCPFLSTFAYIELYLSDFSNSRILDVWNAIDGVVPHSFHSTYQQWRDDGKQYPTSSSTSSLSECNQPLWKHCRSASFSFLRVKSLSVTTPVQRTAAKTEAMLGCWSCLVGGNPLAKMLEEVSSCFTNALGLKSSKNNSQV
jgi:hypothetical protein